MNKFIIETINLPKSFNEENPSLYKVYFGNRYFIHKGKKVTESAERLLDDVYRGMRGAKSCPKEYVDIVAYCKKYPQIYKVTVDVLYNGQPDILLKKETALYNKEKDTELCLNNTETPPYKPEWMLKQSLQKRCDSPITEGVVSGRLIRFKFCPNCGRINK